MTFNVPESFPIGKLAPNRAEREWLNGWCLASPWTFSAVLELGAGVTSWIILDALRPMTYVAVEPYEPAAAAVRKHVPAVQIMPSLDAVPDMQYDLLLVDSSCSLTPGYKRAEAIEMVMPLLARDCVIIIHDFNRQGGAGPKKWLPANGWKLIESTEHRNGWGVYQRGSDD